MRSNAIGLGVIVVLWGMMCLLSAPPTIEAKLLKKCEIVHQLTEHKFPRTFISTWLCLIQSESGGDTKKVTNLGVSSKYGLFQIDSHEWCGKGYYGGKCDVKCESLLTDSMDEANVKCAKKYYERYGFNGWSQWVDKCRLKTLPSIREC